jgi:uncharacterized protein YdgA (DUF945 family)
VKKFLAVLIILAGAYVGAAYMFGGQVRERYFSTLQEYQRYGIVSLSNHAYERGLLSSTAQTLVEISVPAIRLTRARCRALSCGTSCSMAP